MTTTFTCAYLSLGRLHLVNDQGGCQELGSPFADSIQNRAASIARREMWKYSGPGGQFQGGAFRHQAEAAARAKVNITDISRGAEPNHFLYLIHSEDIRGLFRRSLPDLEEQRVFHSNQVLFDHLAYSSTAGKFACALANNDGTSSIALLDEKRFMPQRLTEGDCADTSPAWDPKKEHEIVYESTGLGRTHAGYIAARGRSELHRLNLKTGELNTELSEEGRDLGSPRFDDEGNLYYVSRPRYAGAVHVGLARTLLDVVRAPFRLIQAIGAWLNWFSIRYTGKTLLDQGGQQAREQDLRQLLISANLLHAARGLSSEERETLRKGRFPGSWQLRKRTTDGRDITVVSGVGCFDVLGTSLVYFDGVNLIRLQNDQSPETLCEAKHVQKVLLLQKG